jgi:hypothetical protein
MQVKLKNWSIRTENEDIFYLAIWIASKTSSWSHVKIVVEFKFNTSFIKCRLRNEKIWRMGQTSSCVFFYFLLRFLKITKRISGINHHLFLDLFLPAIPQLCEATVSHENVWMFHGENLPQDSWKNNTRNGTPHTEKEAWVDTWILDSNNYPGLVACIA